MQSKEKNIAVTQTVVDLVSQVFPDTQVVTSMGNHETFPCNNIPPNDIDFGPHDPQWLYIGLADVFQNWYPEEQLQQIRENGTYSIKLQPGFRIVSINSPMCLTYNFFIWMDWSDPGGMLKWLSEQLLEAEQAGDKVHILSHAPPGNIDCLGAWGREYSKIINRFESTVVGQFYGHTHNDEFQIFYDTETNKRASNIAYVTPSVTTHENLNPSYRIYTIDSGHEKATYRVLDSETYVFNLTAANIAGEDKSPNWYRLVSVKEDLDVNPLYPASWDDLVRRMVIDDELYKKWVRFFNKDAEGHDSIFNGVEKRERLCTLLTTSNLDSRKCDEILGPED